MLLPAPAPVLFPLAGLAGAARELERRGRPVRWQVTDCLGVPDLRLVVDAGGPAVSVELLLPGPAGCWWDAVRVEPAGRLLWRGPALECPAEQLVWFVEDLLTRDVEQLPGRYQLLG